jgi:hypothetical protein
MCLRVDIRDVYLPGRDHDRHAIDHFDGGNAASGIDAKLFLHGSKRPEPDHQQGDARPCCSTRHVHKAGSPVAGGRRSSERHDASRS